MKGQCEGLGIVFGQCGDWGWNEGKEVFYAKVNGIASQNASRNASKLSCGVEYILEVKEEQDFVRADAVVWYRDTHCRVSLNLLGLSKTHE